jgi:hypothetical protein
MNELDFGGKQVLVIGGCSGMRSGGPFRVKKTRPNKKLEPGSDSNRSG